MSQLMLRLNRRMTCVGVNKLVCICVPIYECLTLIFNNYNNILWNKNVKAKNYNSVTLKAGIIPSLRMWWLILSISPFQINTWIKLVTHYKLLKWKTMSIVEHSFKSDFENFRMEVREFHQIFHLISSDGKICLPSSNISTFSNYL